MAPIIHCVRHAQGFHNLDTANHVLPDPLLTPLGEEQCLSLRANFPYHKQVDMVVASPMRRTIYTALLGFEADIKSKGLKIVALPEVQETSDVACDTGTDIEALKKEVQEKELPVDLDLVQADWNSNQGKWAPSASAIVNRAREARRWLKSRPEKEIVLVTHGGFLHFFTEDWQDSSLYQGTGWANTEFRSFQFSENIDKECILDGPIDADNATIVETAESRKRRGQTEQAPSREEQKKFYAQAIKGWEDMGLQLSEPERLASKKEKDNGDKKVPEGTEVDGTRV